nr:hypothetical protein [Candidatus Njordarchaeum guaymaensis]
MPLPLAFQRRNSIVLDPDFVEAMRATACRADIRCPGSLVNVAAVLILDDFLIWYCQGSRARDFRVKSEMLSKGKREYLNERTSSLSRNS